MIVSQCPLTFNGAYGLSEENHSIKFCEYGQNRRIRLYEHFRHKHKLKEVYIKRLLRAIADDQDPRKIKLFHENESIIDPFWKVPCPFINGPSSECCQKSLKKIPCAYRFVQFDKLKFHLERYHHVDNRHALKIVNNFKTMRAKHDTVSISQIPSIQSEE